MGRLRAAPAVCRIAIPLALLCAGTAACQRSRSSIELSAWVHGPSVSEHVEAGLITESASVAPRVALAGAINETLSFRISLRAARDGLAQPSFRASALRSHDARIDPSVYRFFRMQAVQLESWPGWHVRSIPPNQRNARPLDVLVPIGAPRGGLPDELRAGEVVDVWVDLAIPKGTAAGTYLGTIQLLSAGSVVHTLELDLTVWPVVLPDGADTIAVVEVDHRALLDLPHVGTERTEGAAQEIDPDGLLASTLAMLHRHRLTPVLPDLSPLVKVGASQRAIVDWGAYDAVVAPLLSGGGFSDRRPLSVWPVPLGPIAFDPAHAASRAERQRDVFVRHYLSACAAHFGERGWLDQSYAYPLRGWPTEVGQSEALQRFAAVARGAKVPLASGWFPQNLAPYGWEGYSPAGGPLSVDIWLPPAQFFDAETMTSERAGGRRTWMQVDRPPFSGTTSVYGVPADVWVLPWQAVSVRAEAIYFGLINRWPAPDASASDCLRGDARTLLFPGGPYGLAEPVASVRLKHLRRGMQDAAYVRLLEEHGLEHVARAVVSALSPYFGSGAYRTHFADGRPNGWPADALPFEHARRALVGELLRKISGDDAGGFGGLERNMPWRRLMAATDVIRIYADGVRIRPVGTPSHPGLSVESVLTLENLTRVPLSGTLHAVDPLEGWSVSEEPVPFDTLQPGQAARVGVTADVTSMPATSDGAIPLTFEFSFDGGASRRVTARAAYVVALPFGETISIDGDLSDWPVTAGNVASNFKLISGSPVERSSEEDRTPRNSTTVFVLRDESHLYLAVNCETPVGEPRPTMRRNRVAYDDLIPVAEELVEFLIDPFNTGTRSPTDLYHIVIKRDGGDLFEKGIRFDPPCGRHESWAVDAELATTDSPGRWTAELRLPLSAFGANPGGHVVWGFNATRFDLAGAEFSSWSGASGNAYDPLSLGNLYFPPLDVKGP